jgi:hypothetical protein
MLTLEIGGSDTVEPMAATLTGPPVAVLAPPPATIDRGQDLTFTWTSAPGTGHLVIGIDAQASGDGHPVVTYTTDAVNCWADVSQGTLTIPSSLLSKLPTDSHLPAVVLAMSYNSERRHAGKSWVVFTADTTATTPGGEGYDLQAELK